MKKWCLAYSKLHIDGLVQERRNSIANTLELSLSCTNPSISGRFIITKHTDDCHSDSLQSLQWWRVSHLDILWVSGYFMKKKNNPIMESQYPCCWWPGNTRNQGINSNGITILNTRRAIRQNSPNTMMFQNSIPLHCETTMQQGMSPWWALLGLISWCLTQHYVN